MKKLLTVLGVIAVAISANAAAITWNSGVLKTPASGEGGWSTANITSGSATGYFWVIDAATYGSLYSTDASKMMANVIDAYATLDTANKKVTITDSSYKSPTSATTAITYKDDGGYGAGDTVYAAMIFVYTDSASGDQYYIANVGAFEFTSAQNKSQTNLAQFIGGGTSGTSLGGWQSVPEPTSGLLMLLGMAGLALRRKRA